MRRWAFTPSAHLAGIGILLFGLVGAGVGCRGEPDARAAEQPAPPLATIDPENVVVLDSVQLRIGPVVSGTLQPEREAQVRAEVSGTVLQTSVAEGDRVAKGELLARIEDRAVQDAYRSAQAQVRSAEANLEVARRNAERAETLAAAGALAARDLETARWQAISAEAALAGARARLVAAERELGFTRVRSPMTGVVSRRAASAGDVVPVGAELFTIVDPRSLEFQGTVPAEQAGRLTRGAPVEFSVVGAPGRSFSGRIDRINPVADPATRQVQVYVSVPNADQRLVAGLFAEGRVATEIRRALLVPAAAIDRRGVNPTVLRLRGGRAEEVPVELGVRDDLRDAIEVRLGVAAGDTLIATAAGVTPGARVRVRSGDAG